MEWGTRAAESRLLLRASPSIDWPRRTSYQRYSCSSTYSRATPFGAVEVAGVVLGLALLGPAKPLLELLLVPELVRASGLQSGIFG